MEEERKLILTMVAEGKITPEEADALLAALEEEEAEAGLRTEPDTQQEAAGPAGGLADVSTGGPAAGPGEPRTPGAARRAAAEEPRSYLEEILGSDLSTLGSTLESVMDRVRDELKQIPDQISRLGLEKKAWVWGFSSHPYVVDFHRRLEWAKGPVQVVNVKGDVHVETWDQGAVDVEADLVVGGNLTDEVRRALEEEGVTLEQRGGVLYVRALEALRRKYPHVRLSHAALRLKVPHGSNVDISAIHGDVSVAGEPGEVRAETVHGDLDIHGGRGRLRTSTRNGDIHVQRFEGETVEMDSTLGDLSLKGSAQAVKISAVRGDVSLDVRSARQVRVDAVSGDVEAALQLEPGATCEMRTVRGDADMRLALSGGFQVSLETTSGDLDCQLPLDQVQKGRGSLKGSRGDGTARIYASTMRGDLTVR